MFPRYFAGEITNWPRLPCYSLRILPCFLGIQCNKCPTFPARGSTYCQGPRQYGI